MQRRTMCRRRRAMDGPVSCAIQQLEERVFLSLSPAGGEFLVNSATLGDQRSAAIAVEGDGDFVVAWTSSTGDGSGSAVFARRYTAGGTAQGSQFLVNTTTLNSQGSPAIAMDSDGDFVIVWSGSDTGYGEIFGQRFNSNGTAQGTEFRVNTYTTGEQVSPAVAMDSSGDFVVAWTSYGQDGSYYGVYAQRYNASGVAQGTEFRASNATLNSQMSPSVAMNSAGDFVVAWTGFASAAAGYDTYARQFNASGVAQGGEFKVNTYTTNAQGSASVAMDASGKFVVAWDSTNQDGSQIGVYAQRYTASAAPQGVEFKVNTYTTNGQRVPRAAMDADGDFVVTWISYQDGDSSGIYAQAYNASGVPEGQEFKVNTYTTSKQFSPAVSMSSEGEFVVAWESHLQDESSYGIYAQRYRTIPNVESVLINGRNVLPYQVHDTPVAQIVVRFSENVTDSGGVSGPNSVTNPANWLITRNGTDVTAGLSVDYGFNFVVNRYEAVLTLSQSYTSGNFLLKAKDNIRDIGGNQLDGNIDSLPGGSFLLPFSVQGLGPAGGEFLVNTTTDDWQRLPAVAANATGSYVVAWQGAGQDGAFYGIYAQRYNSAGVAQGGELQANTVFLGTQTSPDVAMDSSGNFVVVWESSVQQGDPGVFGRRYNSAGVPQGDEFLVTEYTSSSQFEASVAMRGDGSFIVGWTSSGQDGGSLGVYATIFNSSGVRQVSEFRVNSYTTGNQSTPSVAVDAAGNFVVAWQSSNHQDGSGQGIFAKRYSNSGVAVGSEFQINTFTTGDQNVPVVAMSAAGDFAVAWRSHSQDGDSGGIHARRYNASGVAQGGEFPVNSFTTGDQHSPSMAMDAAGNFVVTWSSEGQDGSGPGVYGQRYDLGGAVKDGEFRLNTTTLGDQSASDVATTIGAGFVAAWSGTGTGDSPGVFARRYEFRDTPAVAALTDTPDPVVSGNSFTLTAGGAVADGATVSSVSYYRETNGEPGLQVGAFGDTLVGTDVTESGGFWSVNIPTGSLAAGAYTYWAQATDSTGLTGAPASTTNVVNAPPVPQVVASAFHYDTAPQKLKFTFDRDVSGTDPGDISAADITLIKIGGGGVPTLTMLPYGTDGTNVASFTMNTLLADGNYRATISAAGVTDGGNPMAADHIFDFFILAGDANHDRKVDLQDLVILANNWQGSGKNYSQADFDYNGVVNAVDLGILAQRWQQTLALPAPPLPAVPTSARTPARTAIRTPVRVIGLVT